MLWNGLTPLPLLVTIVTDQHSTCSWAKHSTCAFNRLPQQFEPRINTPMCDAEKAVKSVVARLCAAAFDFSTSSDIRMIACYWQPLAATSYITQESRLCNIYVGRQRQERFNLNRKNIHWWLEYHEWWWTARLKFRATNTGKRSLDILKLITLKFASITTHCKFTPLQEIVAPCHVRMQA